MIYLQLFLNFLMIGTVSFGGGYGMISLIRETVVSNGWLAESEFLNMIAVSESTPGPLAINMATFVGSTQGGFFGALAATFGVVLPSFIIISLIALAMKRLMKYGGVQAFLNGIRPTRRCAVCGIAFVPGSNRAKYCPKCAVKRRQEKEAVRLHNRYLKSRI